MIDAATMRARIQEEARKLAREYGINGDRQPANDRDRTWMTGYEAACRQIIVAADRVKLS